MEYLVVDADAQRYNGEVWEFESAVEAVEYADAYFSTKRGSEHDVKNTGFLAVIKSCNSDEEAEDHFDGDPVKTYIVDGVINPEMMSFNDLGWDGIEMYLSGSDSFGVNAHYLYELEDLDIVHLVEEMPDWSFLEDYPVEEELESRTDIKRDDYTTIKEWSDGTTSTFYDFEKFIRDACAELKVR